MVIELKQQLKLSQQLVMTPQLQMAIKLLQLSRLELLNAIQQELEQNPALDEEFGDPLDDNSPEDKDYADIVPAEKEVTIDEKINPEIDWSNYIDEYNSPGRYLAEFEEKDGPQYEAFIAQRESLSDYLLWQLAMLEFSDQDREIGSLIIGNLDINGYLDVSAEELSAAGNCSIEDVNRMIGVLQSFDPLGICARDLKECLLIQAERLGCNTPLVLDIIANYMTNLENKNYQVICRGTKAGMNEVIEAVNIIKGFEPMPGRAFNTDNTQYVSPDIFVYKIEDDFVILLNDEGMPRLRINSMYRQALNAGGEIADSARDYMQEKIKSASWLIKSIHQRQKTIYRVMESILKFQRDFFEKGIDYLKPMRLKDIAEDIEMHESTISRVTTNKYAYTPQGLFELKYFFNSAINQGRGGEVASISVKEKIKQIIDGENPAEPLSDDNISVFLKKEAGIHIARRTVAKYREMLRILPSNKRRQI